ncbi:hypothetical protein CI109_100963 [Kwoniella shandongensis]|uniref:DUF7918 domain-containing protein n=1 Tax=Kwoniella shandongensis TaxID=1734106 RepID=A0A5M6C4J4_9TREE|nr:uncharacterized protein CI109_001431 [Kwoniella shandongensis]KAA5530028.1 hypothetical protein CI109_001431 [Kwoniella shandongensis]
MRAKHHNGFEAYLTVDGEKLHEHRLKKSGEEGDVWKMECYVEVKPQMVFTINVRLGRRTPWKSDLIAEPTIDGRSIHSLHVKKNWHRAHTLHTVFEEDPDGDLKECQLTFGKSSDLDTWGEVDDNDDDDDGRGTITIEVSRGEVEKIKPVKKRIEQRINGRGNGRGGVIAGNSIASVQNTAFAEEFRYDDEDCQQPWIRFVFKYRTRDCLIRNRLLDRIPAQQHPVQVCYSTKVKVEPDTPLSSDDEQIDPEVNSSAFGVAVPLHSSTQPSRSIKRERDESMDQRIAERNRQDMLQKERDAYKARSERLARARKASVMTVDTMYGL